MVRHLALTSVLVAASSTMVAGAGFLEPTHGVTTATVDGIFLSETSSRIKQVEELKATLHTTYVSLPKNEHGNLDPSTVRYALHRYFVRTYGWYVKGLDTNGDAWNTNSSAVIMEDHVPEHIMGLLEKRVDGRGIDLSDLAIFAATLTELIERDVTSGFEQCYAAVGLTPADVVEDSDFDIVFQGYLAKHLYGDNEQNVSSDDLKHLQEELEDHFPGWSDTKMWLKDSRLTMGWAQESRRNPFITHRWTFPKFETAVHDIMHRFVEVSVPECQSLKGRMLAIEYKGTGRVRLSDFYTANKDHLLETAEYLRDLGVLDESDPQRPMLMIPNYMSSRVNCLVDTSYYSTCCVNECEGLLLQLERKLANPIAEPARIAEIVSSIPSDTVDAPRNLSLTLTRRLTDIASVHDGRVPIHGRLFSQWMHHAYPRECPYPHPTGSFKQMTQDEWTEHKDVDDVLASKEEISLYTSNPAYLDMEEMSPLTDDTLPWTSQEEIVATHRGRDTIISTSTFKNLFRIVMGCVALLSMALPLTRTFLARRALLSDKVTCCV